MQQSFREKKELEIAFPFLLWESEMVMFPPHWHDCFEIVFVNKGGMYVSVDDTICEVAADSLIMVDSCAPHGFFDARAGTSIIGMQFDITFFDEGFLNVRDLVFHNPVISKDTLNEAVYTHLRRLLREISAESRRRDMGYQLAVKAKLYELMLVILREGPKVPHKNPSSRAKQIRSFVYKNYDNPDLTVEEAAHSFKLSKFYFTRFFKKHISYSFHSYLTRIRIDFARRYLIESRMSITDVAFHSGFNSLQTFNRVFKTMTGFAPGKYRREHSAHGIVLGSTNYDTLSQHQF